MDVNSRINSNNNAPLLPSQDSAVANKTDGVQLGYSTASSSEVVESNSPVSNTQNDEVALDQPEVVPQAPVQELSFVAGNAQLSGLQESVKFFNERFDINALDMADTASVLLMIKGMVSDMRALSSLGSIDSASKELLTQLDRNIATANNLVTQKEGLINKQTMQIEKQDSKAAKEILLAEKESALTNEGGTNEQLESEIALLKQEIGVLTTDIEVLTNDTAALTKNINLGENSLNKDLESGIQRVFLITNGIKQRFDKSILNNGEEQRVVTDKINHDIAVTHEKTNQMLRKDKNGIRELDKAQINNQDARNNKVVDERRLEKALHDFGVNIPDGVLALLSINDVESPDTLLNNLRKEMPDEKAIADIAKVFGAILGNNDRSPKITNQTDIEQKHTKEPVTKDRGASVEQPRFTGQSALATPFLKIDTEQANRTDSQANKKDLLVSSATADIRKIGAMKLESEAMSLVAKAEEERRKAESIISKNSPV